jgi:hypothetical protein
MLYNDCSFILAGPRLTVTEKKVIRRVSVPERGREGNCKMRFFVICIFHQILLRVLKARRICP